MNDPQIHKDVAALELIRRAHMNVGNRLCAASHSQDEDILDLLRSDSMYEFAEFYFMLVAMGMTEPEDIRVLADSHNHRVQSLLNDPAAMRRRKLRKERLLAAIFTSDTRPRLEQVWREAPGSLDQSNLARFLIPQMSAETTRKLVVACETAGFLTRTTTVFGTIIVNSTLKMELIFRDVIQDMRLALKAL